MIRDRRTVVMSVVVPLVLLLLFGFAVSFDIHEIRLAVWDRDDSARSREVIRAFVSSRYFREIQRVDSEEEARRSLDTGRVSVVLAIPRGLGRSIDRREPAEVQVLVDGTDSSRASVIQGHVRNIVQTLASSLIGRRLREQGESVGHGAPESLLPIECRTRVLYNPELKSRNFMVPGLIGVLLTMLGVLQTSLAIAREKDRGTLEQLRTTPLRAWEILVGKMLPYAVVAFANAWIALGAGWLLMDVPVRGSLLIFLLGTVLFLVSALGIGLVISALTSTQQAAQTAAFLGSVLPVFYLSDYMFPIRNMPVLLQAVTWLIPARYYVAVLRGTLQKGVGLAEMRWAFVGLAVYAVSIGLVGILSIRRAFR